MNENFSIKHHRLTFKDETIILNNVGFVECKFNNCRLNLLNQSRDTVLLVSCDFDDSCELLGEGWNYGFVEAWYKHLATKEPLEWAGPIGNEEITKH